MYPASKVASVRELTELPQSDVGAPSPMAVGDEHHLGLAFYLQDTPDDWHGQYVTVVDPTETVAPIALIWFRYVLAAQQRDRPFMEKMLDYTTSFLHYPFYENAS